jgi:hypothetical protein
MYYMDSISGIDNKQVIALGNYVAFPNLRECMCDGLIMECNCQHRLKRYAHLLKSMFMQTNINSNKI